MNLTKKGKSRYHYRDIGAIISRNSRYVQTSKKSKRSVQLELDEEITTGSPVIVKTTLRFNNSSNRERTIGNLQ